MMKVVLCVDIYKNEASNDRMIKTAPEASKYLCKGDEISVDYDDFVITKKSLHLDSDTLFLYIDYDVDEHQDSIDNVIGRLEEKGFKKNT